MVASTVSMLVTPWLLARFAYRATYAGCMWLLLAGGLLGGFAHNYPLVLAARVMEGLAAGVVQPIPAIVIMRAFQPHEQGRASGLFGMGVVLAPAVGPSIGGLLVAMVLVTVLFVSQVVLGLLLAAIRKALPYDVHVPGWVDWSRLATPVSLFLILWALFRLLSPRSYRHCASWPGALLTTFVWIASVYIAFPMMASFGGMGLTYGALSGVMLALLFFYVIGFSLVAGAELNASIARARNCGASSNSS